MTNEQTGLAERFVECLNRHDAEALRDLLDNGYVNHNPFVSDTPGPESAVGFFADWLVAFPDATVVCEDAFATGTPADGSLVGRFTYLGTFTNTADWFAQLQGAEPQLRTGATSA